jgi:hypothetical protein
MTICSPIASCARLKDWLINARAAGSSEASGRIAKGIPAERPYPWHRKPQQRGRLKYKAKAECGLIGDDWIMSSLRWPLPDHDVLNGMSREGDSVIF